MNELKVGEKHHPAPTPLPAPEPELSDWEKELALQKKDMEQAIKEEDAAVKALESLPEQFHYVEEYVGIGPRAYETKRGFIKVLSGDVIISFEFPIPGTDPVVMEKETVVMSKAAAEAIQGLIPPDPPVGYAARAARITTKRHEAAAPKPVQPIVEPKKPAYESAKKS